MRTLIVVPARYGSTRFPGKPLAKINGVSMLRRTARIAALASQEIQSCDYVVATDDERIEAHCADHGIAWVLTSKDMETGSDRALAAAEALGTQNNLAYDRVINLQGDAPFTPVSHITALAEAMESGADVVTPYVQLSWGALDALRNHKIETPFSGTTLVSDTHDHAIWFSKNIIPAIRKEEHLRQIEPFSPVKRHIGLYGYKIEVLKRFTKLNQSRYETYEGLEQLRLIENGISIKCVSVPAPLIETSGIDSPSDVIVAEKHIRKHGDPFQ